jgi:quinol monooxygenase YgiN
MITLHLRIRIKSGNEKTLLSFLREAIPFYEAPGGIRVRLLANRADPDRFIEVIEYETRSMYDADQLRIDRDPHLRSLINRWRGLLASPPEVEVYEEVSHDLR